MHCRFSSLKDSVCNIPTTEKDEENLLTETTEALSNEDDDDEEDSEEENNDEENNDDNSMATSRATNRTTNSKKRSNLSGCSSQSKQPKWRKKADSDELLMTINKRLLDRSTKTKNENDDEHSVFGKMIANELRGLTPRLQIMFKKEVNDVVFNYQLKNEDEKQANVASYASFQPLQTPPLRSITTIHKSPLESIEKIQPKLTNLPKFANSQQSINSMFSGNTNFNNGGPEENHQSFENRSFCHSTPLEPNFFLSRLLNENSGVSYTSIVQDKNLNGQKKML